MNNKALHTWHPSTSKTGGVERLMPKKPKPETEAGGNPMPAKKDPAIQEAEAVRAGIRLLFEEGVDGK